jgi:hypothetical protein
MANAVSKTALWLAMAAVAANGHLFAQGIGEPPLGETYQEAGVPAQPVFSVEQVEQMVAPIALYPDALLAQILMASTYPIEVAQAHQWLGRNRGLEDQALDDAVAEQPWDPSVKTLVFFPSVLDRMAQDLTWTQDLGDAFLAQEADVMGAIQHLRRQAQEAGNLASNDQQIVRTEGSTILVEPADPTVVYVPTYNPRTVYGSTWVPATTYYPTTYSYGSSLPAWVVFGAGALVGAILTAAIDWADDDDYYVVYPRYRRPYHRHIHYVYYSYWDRDWDGPRYGRPAWRSYRPVYLSRGDVYIDNSKTVNVTNTYVRREWEHNPVHRRSVAYRDPGVAKRFVETASVPPAGSGAAQLPGVGSAVPSDRGRIQEMDRGALRRLDPSQRATLPSDRGTREALQGDERERRDRILRSPRDAAPGGAAAETPEAVAKRRALREAEQRQWERAEPRQAPRGVEPQEAQPQAQRQWQPRTEPRVTPQPQRVEPREAQPQAQRQWSQQRSEARPAPQRSEPQETQRQVQRQWQPRPESRQVPQAVEPRVTPQPSPRQWQSRPETRQSMPQRSEPQVQPRVEPPRQVQQRVEPPRQVQQRVEPPRQVQQRVEPPRQTQQRVEPRPTPQAAPPNQAGGRQATQQSREARKRDEEKARN